jgi:hypothetical protein
MTDHLAKQRAYEAKRPKLAPPLPSIITREVHHIGGVAMAHPLTITYRADQEAETLERLHRAGLTWDGGDLRPVGSWW